MGAVVLVALKWLWGGWEGKGEGQTRGGEDGEGEDRRVRYRGEGGVAKLSAEEGRSEGWRKRGWWMMQEGEPIVLLTWPFQLPQRRLISAEVSSGNYHIVSWTRGYARRSHTHARARTHCKTCCYGYLRSFLPQCGGKKTEKKKIEIDKSDEGK